MSPHSEETIREIAKSLCAEMKKEGEHFCVKAEQLTEMQTLLKGIDEKLKDIKTHEARITALENTMKVVGGISVLIVGIWTAGKVIFK